MNNLQFILPFIKRFCYDIEICSHTQIWWKSMFRSDDEWIYLAVSDIVAAARQFDTGTKYIFM